MTDTNTVAGSPPETGTRIHYRTCPLCEATCGLEITMRGADVVRIRGDRDDVFSKGYICPKGSTIKDLDADPDRVRVPMIRTGSVWREATWPEAFRAINDGLRSIRERHGNDAVAIYVGNPNAHNLSGALYNAPLIKAFATKNLYSASTVDQMPKQVSAGMMFGAALNIPVPDVDRCDYLLMLGANPYDSNGSLMTAPDLPGRLEAMRARGGRLVVVDPRRSKTAERADEHVFIRPGGDAAFLLAIVHVLFADRLVRLGAAEGLANGLEELERLANEFAPESVAAMTGIDGAMVRRIAHELIDAPTAAVYGRIGTCTQEFGTMSSWLIDVVNTLTGNLDRIGGAMFTRAAAGAANTHGKPGVGRGVRFGRWTSRVRSAGEVFGELPVGVLPEEIETPGDGQIRALITVAGNPVLSNPDSTRLDAALSTLEFMVSVDIYRNETTKHANVILPSPRILTKSHYDMSLYQLAVRNVANWSAPIVEPADGEMPEWEVLLRLAAIGLGLGPDADIDALDEGLARVALEKAVASDESTVCGRDVDELLGMLSGRRGPDRLLDIQLRTGPYGDSFGSTPDGLTLDVLVDSPHGVDLGALEPRLPEVLRTPSGRIELAPVEIVADVDRLRVALRRASDASTLLLVGRRHLRSNNSWMHNVRVLVKGKDRCTLHVHPDDAARLALVNGARAHVKSLVGSVSIAVEVTDSVMRGVVSIPHGWGHDHDGTQMTTAARYAGVNTNVLIPGDAFDPLSGNAILNGVRVAVTPV